MVCNVCGQNEATIHLTEIVNSQMIEIHLCETCAQEKGTDFKTHFNFADLLGLADTGFAQKIEKIVPERRCTTCKMTYEDFGKTGRLGCAACYDAFAKLLLPLIKRVQASTQHVGKRPSRLAEPVRSAQDLRELHNRLQKSIQQEAFEEAARIRDQIRQLEEKLKKGKKKS